MDDSTGASASRADRRSDGACVMMKSSGLCSSPFVPLTRRLSEYVSPRAQRFAVHDGHGVAAALRAATRTAAERSGGGDDDQGACAGAVGVSSS